MVGSLSILLQINLPTFELSNQISLAAQLTQEPAMYEPLNNCLDCKHFYFDPGSPGYSEQTPGSDMSLGCYKDHWSGRDCYSQDDFRKHMLSAKTCKDYVPNLEPSA